MNISAIIRCFSTSHSQTESITQILEQNIYRNKPQRAPCTIRSTPVSTNTQQTILKTKCFRWEMMKDFKNHETLGNWKIYINNRQCDCLNNDSCTLGRWPKREYKRIWSGGISTTTIGAMNNCIPAATSYEWKDRRAQIRCYISHRKKNGWVGWALSIPRYCKRNNPSNYGHIWHICVKRLD